MRARSLKFSDSGRYTCLLKPYNKKSGLQQFFEWEVTDVSDFWEEKEERMGCSWVNSS